MAKEIPTASASRLEPLSVVWRAFAAPQTLMVFLGLVALALVLASLIPQIPPQALADPQTWLAVQSGPLSSGTSLVRILGLYDVYHSFWFRLLLVLTGLTLFVWMLDAADLAWRITRRKPWTSAAFAHWGSHAAQARVLSFLGPEDALAQLRQFLEDRGYRWADVPDLPAPNLVASRRGETLWSRPVAFGALLLALIGLVIANTWGWQELDWQPAPGDLRTVGHDTPYRLRLDSFEPKSAGDSLLCNYRSQVTWLKEEEPVGQGLTTNGQPATLQGIAVRQVGYVPAITLRVWDENGRPLALQPAGSERSVPGRLDIFFPSPEAQPLILIPAKDLLLSLIFEPFGMDGRPLLRVVLVGEGGTRTEVLGALSESGSLAAGELQVDADLAYRPILQVSHRPAVGLVLAGLSLGFVALALGWLVPARLVWIAVAPGEEGKSLLWLLALPGAGHGRWLPLLAARLREVLVGEA
jgi:ResB-like family